ncbi:MAG: hypothetical protein E6Q24_07140 [Chitinophagaceae bacterium]|nr:MAG: hypothetical protein E6Q24_07140 [Chitinophagaceae bacterium]
MKDIVSKVKSFVTFELPVQPAYVHAKFASLHERFQTEDPNWSTAATKQKLISAYWLRSVPIHFLGILTISLIALSIVGEMQVTDKLIANLFVASVSCYLVLLVFHYTPEFMHNYLPQVENATAIYEERQNENMLKCRQAQLPNFSLTLLFFVFAQINGIEILHNDEKVSKLLMKIYGIDPGSIKKNLDMLISPRSLSKVSNRKMTEIRNCFNDVYQVFEELHLEDAVDYLKRLESRTVQRNTSGND